MYFTCILRDMSTYLVNNILSVKEIEINDKCTMKKLSSLFQNNEMTDDKYK